MAPSPSTPPPPPLDVYAVIRLLGQLLPPVDVYAVIRSTPPLVAPAMCKCHICRRRLDSDDLLEL